MIATANETALNNTLSNIENSVDDFDKNIESIIIPDNINITKYDQENVPILGLGNEDFLKLREYDFQKHEENYYFFIICK